MNLPVSQFYHVSVDNADPYHVYGGLQDNSSLGGRFVLSRRREQLALGKYVWRRWLLDVGRPRRSGLHLRRSARWRRSAE